MLTARIAAYFSFLPPLSYLLYRPQRPGHCLPSFPSALTLLFLILVLGNRTVEPLNPMLPPKLSLECRPSLPASLPTSEKHATRHPYRPGTRDANGGVNGRKLRLVALDDGYEPARTALNMRQLIEKEHVLALIGNVGSPTAIVAVPLANEQKTLLFAPFGGGPILRNDPRTVTSSISARAMQRRRQR